MFRLKSCVDFKPYEGESSYIISRTDRDDYVTIQWDEIIQGYEHNFNTYDENTITDLNTPYDYESVMHYAPFSFNKNESIPTITTKIPEFNGIIGQRLDFSAIDLERLNRMYNCRKSQKSQKAEMGCLAALSTGAGYFMYFNTSSGEADKVALLESRILYPMRKQQCLQFFYKMTGSPTDKLSIWVRRDDGTGNVRKLVKIQTFQGDSDHNWKIAHVTLTEEKKFRYLFQGTKGDPKNSDGGIFLDDITLTETPCPTGVWTIRNISQVLANTVKGDTLLSPRFYSSEGYGIGVTLYPNGRVTSNPGYLGLSFHLYSGENDAILEWPVENRQAIMTILDQDPDVRNRMSLSLMFTTSKSHTSAGRSFEQRKNGPSVGWTLLKKTASLSFRLCIGMA
ncbi:Meprin A subunit alpha [Lemmus lemmus]